MDYVIQKENRGYTVWSVGIGGSKVDCLELCNTRRSAMAKLDRLYAAAKPVTPKPPTTTYVVGIRYRTNSGCNVKHIQVEAENMEKAIDFATAKVRKQRGVIRIDGGDCHILMFSTSFQKG